MADLNLIVNADVPNKVLTLTLSGDSIGSANSILEFAKIRKAAMLMPRQGFIVVIDASNYNLGDVSSFFAKAAEYLQRKSKGIVYVIPIDKAPQQAAILNAFPIKSGNVSRVATNLTDAMTVASSFV